MTMAKSRWAFAAVIAAALAGCRDPSPPPPRVPVPASAGGTAKQYDEVRPLPPPPEAPGALPFDDVPLVTQRPPEQAAYVAAHRGAGRPTLALRVNRAVAAQDHDLPPGQYDEAEASRIDYQAIENIMLDWLAADGQVPVLSAQATTPADVVVHVAARPTRQTRYGLEVRLVAEAVEARDGASLARAVVDVPPPLEKTTINRSTRFLARSLMDEMTATWSSRAR